MGMDERNKKELGRSMSEKRYFGTLTDSLRYVPYWITAPNWFNRSANASYPRSTCSISVASDAMSPLRTRAAPALTSLAWTTVPWS